MDRLKIQVEWLLSSISSSSSGVGVSGSGGDVVVVDFISTRISANVSEK